MNEDPKPAIRHVVISGGSRGLGQAIVEGLLASGYSVSTFSRKPTPFTKTLAKNPGFLFRAADIADPRSIDAFLRAAQSAHGPPFALINYCEGWLLTVSWQQCPNGRSNRPWKSTDSSLRLTRRVLRWMLPQDCGGVIINISSIVGIQGYSGLAAYAATKGGMDAMTRALARELGDRMIRVD